MRGNILRGWTVNYYILYYILQLIIFGVLYQIIQPIQTYNMEALPIQTLTDPWYGIVLMNYVFFYACLYNEWSAVGVACGWLKQHRQGHGLPTTWWLWGAWILLEWSELIHWLNVMLGLAYNQFKEMHASPLCIYTVDSVGLARSWEGIHRWKCCPQSERQKMCDWCHAPECLL
jgi:hypothetical protein